MLPNLLEKYWNIEVVNPELEIFESNDFEDGQVFKSKLELLGEHALHSIEVFWHHSTPLEQSVNHAPSIFHSLSIDSGV